MLSGADCIEYYAGLAASLHGEHYQLKGAFAYTRREPLGICVGIGAWNYPIQIACWKSAPALACGNAMIFKPAELTPLTAALLAEVYTEAGLPAGVFNVIQGDARAGQLLVRHPAVAKVSLTGEVGTGKRVMADAAGTLKHVTMELGGKSPLIIFDDADLDNAVAAAMMGNFYTQGEVCTNGTRVFVHESIHDAFLERARGAHAQDDDRRSAGSRHAGRRAHLGGAHEPRAGRHRGRQAHRAARLRRQPRHARRPRPRLFRRADDLRRLHRRHRARDRRDLRPGDVGAEIHDGGRSGAPRQRHAVSGSPPACSRAISRARIASSRRCEAGVCWINNYNITPVEIPFGGMKQSGIGRENGLVTIGHYTQLKSVYVEMGDVACPY